jgi:hypothetical protein
MIEGNHYLEAAGLNIEKIKFLYICPNRPAADLFNDADTVIGVNHFIADVEIQVVTAHSWHPGRSGLEGKYVYWY